MIVDWDIIKESMFGIFQIKYLTIVGLLGTSLSGIEYPILYPEPGVCLLLANKCPDQPIKEGDCIFYSLERHEQVPTLCSKVRTLHIGTRPYVVLLMVSCRR